MKKLLMTLVAAFAAVTLIADTETIGGYTWTYTISGDEAIINNNTLPAITPAPSGYVEVPATLGDRPVTTIGQYAFRGYSGITGIDIPDTVTSIGRYAFKSTGLTYIAIPASITSIDAWAFDNCSELTWITVDVGNANYKSVNGMLLTKDGTTLVQGINGGVTIPDGVTIIGDSAFTGCSGLWSVTLPNSVTNIDSFAFYECVGLTSVTIPGGVTTIKSSAFKGCAGLTVVIADGMTSIPDSAFKGCTGIKRVLIPGSVKTIGESAFEDCTGLDCLSICSGVSTIKTKAFKGCTSLDYVTIPIGVSDIGTDAFGNCTALSHAHLPYTGPFYGNSALVNDIFSGTTPAYYSTITKENVDVAAVGDVGFAYTSSFGIASLGCKLTGGGYLWAIPKTATGDLIIPATLDGYPVTVIRDSAFKGCAGLERVTIPSSVTSIASDAFNDCTSLLYAAIPTDFESSVDSIFAGHGGSFSYSCVNVSMTLVDGILWTYVVDGSGNATIGDGYGAPAVLSPVAGALTIPASIDGNPVTAIGDDAFYGHSDITSVTIPSGVTEIGNRAFCDCVGLQDIVIPQSVMTCGMYVFSGCSHLVNAVAPVDCESYEYNIFYDSPARTTGSIEYRNVDVASVDGMAWVYTVDDGKATVGGGVYQLAISPYTTFGDIAIPSALGSCLVTAIGDCAFSGCDGLTSVTIPDGVEVIEVSAFEGCSGLTSVTMPNSLTTIGEYAFEDCTGLTDVTIPEGVTAIEDSAFCNCTGLSTVTISSTVTNIHSYAFDGCSGLMAFSVADANTVYSSANGLLLSKDGKTLVKGVKGEVTIPGGVETIGDSAFWGAGLTSVVIPASVTVLDQYAFGDCALLSEIAIPPSVTAIGFHAFGSTPLTTVHVGAGDTDRVKGLLEGSSNSTAGITFVEDVPPIYTATFNANGGTVGEATRSVYYGAAVGVLPVPTLNDDYEFVGWFTAAEGGEQITAATIVTADVTFFAQWKRKVIDPESLDPFDPGDLPCYDVLNPADIWDPFKAPKAVTLTGALYYGCDVVGIVELKVGKMKDYQAKVSGTVTLLDGKKYTIKSQKCGFGDKLASSLNLDVKGGGRLKIAIGSMVGVNVFSGSLGKWHVQSAKVGGSWGKNSATFSMDATTIDSLPSGTLEALLPTNEVATAAGGKWKFKKAASVKWTKVKAGVVPLVQDATTGKGLVVDTSKDKTNRSGLKLTYTPKKGTFKGTFKLYELKSGKLKKYTVNVSGVVVDGVGYGKATSKKPVIDWPVTIK